MLKKLLDLLGKELSDQVEAKLGDIELAVMNDGTVVKADKHETLKTENAALQAKYQTDISDVNNKLTAAMANTADYETLKGTLTTLQAENLKIADEHREALLNIKKDSTVDKALVAANAKEVYHDIIKSQLNTDSLQLEGDNLIGLTDRMAKMVETYPDMFGEVKATGAEVVTGVKTVEAGTYKAKYDEAIKVGNRKQAIRIKQEAFDKGEGF